MSDTSGGDSGGGVQATQITGVVTADTSQARTAILGLGQTMVNTAQQGVSAIQGIGSSLGSQNPFAPMMSSVNGLGQGLAIITQNSGPAAEGLGKVAKTGGLLMGVGTAIAGISAGIQTLAGPIEQAQAGLVQVVQNVGHSMNDLTASGKTVNDMFKEAGATAARYGFNLGTVDDSLTRLTAITKDPTEAVKELNLAEIITTQTHSGLAQATQMLGQAHGGMYRQFRQFGLDLPNINTRLADTAKAETAVKEASDHLSSAQKNLADYNEQLSQKLQAQKDAWAQKVQSANQAAQDSEEKYTNAVEAYNQKKETDESNWAEAVQNATDAVATAESNLSDLEARQAAEEADRQAQRQEQIENQVQSTQDAQQRLAQLKERQMAQGPARSASEEVSRQQELANATEEVGKQQEKLNDLKNKPLDTDTQALDNQQQLNKATEGVNTAQDKLNDAVLKQQQGEAKLAIEANSVNQAYDTMLDAQQKSARIQAQAAVAGQATSAELEKQRHLTEAVGTATEREQKAQDNLNAAKDEQNKLVSNFQTIEDFLTSRFGGVLEARRKTFKGFLDNMKADITNWVGTSGQSIAQIGIGIGGALAGVGGLARMGQSLAKIPELFKKTKGEVEPLAKGLSEQMQLPGMAAEGMATSASEAAPSFIASVGSMLAVVGPIAAIVAAIALVAYAGYDIVKHWKVISEDLKRGWGVIENFGKQIWGDITGFFKRWWPEILGIFTGGIGLLVVEVVKHWKDIKQTGEDIWNGITGFFKRFWPELLGVFTGGIGLIVVEVVRHWSDIKKAFSDGAKDVIKFVKGIPDDIKNLFSDAFNWLLDAGTNVIKGLASGILSAAEDLLSALPFGIGDKLVQAFKDALGVQSPSHLTRQMGKDFMRGLSLGVDDESGAVTARLNQMGQTAAQATLTGLRTPGSTLIGGRASLPGSGGVGVGAAGGQAMQVFQIRFDVAGSIVSQDNFFQQFRQWLVQQGLHQGGNYIGAGSTTV